MNRLVRRVVAAISVCCLSGCSLFGSRMQAITVSSDPTGAVVIVNGDRVGNTPLRTYVSRGEDLLVEVRKPGYETVYRTSSRGLSTLGILDVIGGVIILLPFFGLISSAAWEHDRSVYGVILTPLERQPSQGSPN